MSVQISNAQLRVLQSWAKCYNMSYKYLKDLLAQVFGKLKIKIITHREIFSPSLMSLAYTCEYRRRMGSQIIHSSGNPIYWDHTKKPAADSKTTDGWNWFCTCKLGKGTEQSNCVHLQVYKCVSTHLEIANNSKSPISQEAQTKNLNNKIFLLHKANLMPFNFTDPDISDNDLGLSCGTLQGSKTLHLQIIHSDTYKACSASVLLFVWILGRY